MVNCPLCNAVIDVDEDELDEGDEMICEECGANLNVTGVSPLELSAAEDDGFDDEDDDDDDEDDDFDEDDDDDEDDDAEDEDDDDED
jgi:lysine biosynthesis protein LysW